MTATSTSADGGLSAGSRHLRRNVGFWGLMFVSLGSIIGSGWLLGALTAATVAGPASLLSWILAAAMLLVLALVHAELGGAYPMAGGTARFPFFSFGPLAGFASGWFGWVQAVTIAPIEVEATLSYVSHLGWVKDNIDILHTDGTLTGTGIVIASVFMLLFTLINAVGVKLLSDSNAVMVVWKALVPLLTVVVLLTVSFHSGNFTAGGFAPFGAHGVFAALPAGVVFATMGFEQAIQMAGEARNPQRDLSRAVVVAMIVGVVIYLLLEVAFVGALDPHNLVHGWANPIGKGNFGPYVTLASSAGIVWLAVVLYIDAVVSPAGTGLLYLATSSRLSYAMGSERTLPRLLSRVSLRGVPLPSIIVSFVVGEIVFLPFPSWQSLVGLITSATVLMYAFGPVSLHALRLQDPDRARPYRLPAWKVLSPVAFVCANLIIYWSGFEAAWKLGASLLIGLALFFGTRFLGVPAHERPDLHWKASAWMWPWLGGLVLVGYLGRYGGDETIPEWWDLAVVTLFSLAVYYGAVRAQMPREYVNKVLAADEEVVLTSNG
ncbi:amino acid transporter [Streptomyces hygroscopicus]|uniref:APC family permease n=1 Tax=Streptomyces hygroscopicus TaxID=1912 RepID=UPI00223F46E4|nr:APC family permease [Streptomyces hygroscopicus]MCW7942811.1 amino acid transporter [Streptomyces hygroscopicus]